MKKTLLSIAVIAAAFVAVSCQKDNLQDSVLSEKDALQFTATIEAGAGTKTTVERIAGTPATYKTKWESTDKININGVSYTATPDGTDATKATFAPDDTEASKLDGKYKAVYPTSLSFKNLCGVLAITVSGADFTSVNSIEVSSDKQMNGKFTATAAGVLAFASKELTDADKKVSLTFASAKSIAADGSATFYIPVPPNTHNPLTIKVSDGPKTKTMVTKKSGGVEVVRNTVYPIAFEDNSLPEGALSGEFSVNAIKKVHFSQGNLWANTTVDPVVYSFETNQYEIQGSWSTSHVSHFFWSKDASVAYAESFSESGTTGSEIFFTNATVDTPRADFTVNGVTGQYRTLSTDE